MEELFTQLINSIVDGEPEITVALTQQALDKNIEPLVIIENALVPGMQIVGDKFSSGEYFLPNLIISANGMQQAMQLLEPALTAPPGNRQSSRHCRHWHRPWRYS